MRSAFYEKKSLPAQLIFSHKLGDAPHLHKEIEIIYVAEGEAVAHADRNCESICKDSLFISFPNQIHFYESCHPGEYYILIVRPELFFGLSSTFRDYNPEHNTFAEAQELFPYIHQAFSAEGEYRDTMIAGSLSMMMCRLLPQLSLRKKLESGNSTLHSILEYCSRNASGPLELETVAEEMHLSRFYVSRLLSRELRMGFSEYVNLLRVNRACDLLNDTDKKIADISEDAGFSTIRSFNRAFARHMNMTPIQYRKMLREAQAKDLR